MNEVEPRHHTPRSSLPTHGGRVAKVRRAKGSEPMPWQRAAADVALEYDPDTGLNRFGTVIVSVPRQAGKTALEGDVADAACLWRPRVFVRITMQDGKTADEWMREQHFPSLEGTIFDGRYRESRRAGSHGPHWLHTKSSFTTFPPTRKALHSKQTDLAFVDEAWAHDAETGRELKQAIRPTMNTRTNAQLWIVSTRGDNRSAYLDEYIARGRASLLDPNSRTCFIDYGIPDGADADDLDVIAAHHPAIGHTINRRSLADAYDEFRDPETGAVDLAGWARAYGNRGTDAVEILFPDTVWTDAARPREDTPDRAGLALDVSPAGDRYAIAAGWRDTNDDGRVEIIAAGPVNRETPALAANIARRRRVPLHVDRRSAATLALVDQFAGLPAHNRPEVEFVNVTQFAGACLAMYRGIFADTVHHDNDPDLDNAVRNAVRADAGDGGFVWSRKMSAGSIAELNAATLALRAFEVLPAPRRRAVARA